MPIKKIKENNKITKEKAGKGKTILIITEKPAAAEKIAAALSNGTDEKITDKNKVSYYEFERNGKRAIVACAVGHLFGIQQKEARGGFPNFDVEWKPNYKKKSAEYTKRYLDVIKKLCKQADEFIVATDFDIEGEVIGWNVIRFICNQKDAKRMKFSSLTKDELEKSFENLLPNLEWGSAIAGETRHYLDWFYGINLSRGLMKALSSTGKFRILSIGRVQGPALKIVYDREMKIKNFKPESYWQVFLLVQDIHKKRLEVMFPENIIKESELLKFQHLKGKKGIANTIIKDEKISPPAPFDLTTLQTEAYRNFGLSPSQTLQIAQNLYLGGVISYPRTSSQKYPEAIGYDKILKQLKKYTQLIKYAVNKKPVEGKKSDPAHPAIYPTGEIKKLNEQDRKVYDLIVRRFISCFCSEAIVEDKKVKVEVSGLKFYASGKKIKEKGWMNVYKSGLKEQDIGTMNGEVDVKEIRIEEKQTQPPKRYTAASLVKELEKKNLGTKSTRASIVDTLQQRGYTEGKSIEASDLGIKMIETLMKYSPIIVDEKLTREIEKEMDKMQGSRDKLKEQEEKVLEKSKKAITKIAEDITKNLEKIGKSLADANEKTWEKQKQENTLAECKKCGEGKLRIMFNRKARRYFIACDAYPKCRTTYSLPPNALIKPAKTKNQDSGEEQQELCKECGFPLVIALRKGRKPWKFCFNPECASNKGWEKKKEEYKAGLGGEKVVDGRKSADEKKE